VNVTELRAAQAPFKERYRNDPASAQQMLVAKGELGITTQSCRLEIHKHEVVTGLHPSTGGDGLLACSAEIMLQSLVSCAGVTLTAVATAMELPVTGGTITAEGDLDFRGTLGVSKDVPIGFSRIRMTFDLQTTATAEQLATLIKLTERYCVVFQTLKHSPEITTELVTRA
jgi:uncharacterized OsmC-like protein